MKAWLKWKFWKALAWLTKPWHPKEVIDNPRGKKRRKESAAYLMWVDVFKMLNLVTGAFIGVALMLLFLLRALAP